LKKQHRHGCEHEIERHGLKLSLSVFFSSFSLARNVDMTNSERTNTRSPNERPAVKRARSETATTTTTTTTEATIIARSA
jgi:hypothetical protein